MSVLGKVDWIWLWLQPSKFTVELPPVSILNHPQPIPAVTLPAPIQSLQDVGKGTNFAIWTSASSDGTLRGFPDATGGVLKLTSNFQEN